MTELTKEKFLQLTPEQVLHDPELFALVFLKILDKQKNLVPFRWNRAQKDFHRNRTRRNLILKARQLGFSTAIQGEMFRRTVTSTRSTLTLAHDDNTTGLLRRMADRFWENCKMGTIQPKRDYANATLTTYPELQSEAMIAKAGSVEVGRGSTLTDMHGSETAYWADAEKIVVGALQSGDPDCTLESTPNGASGYFFEKAMESLDGGGVWKLHFYSWFWDDSYRLPVIEPLVYTDEEARLVAKHHLKPEQIAWRRNKQLELGRFFAQEYPEDPVSCFLTSGEGYFGDLSHSFTAPDNANFDKEHRYRAGLDFAQSKDFTDMVILDMTTRQQVDYLHVNRMEWAEIRDKVALMYYKWRRKRCANGHISDGNVVKCKDCSSTDLSIIGLKSITAEKNSIGQPNIEALQSKGITVEAFQTDINSKREILANLYEGLHTGGLKLLDNPSIRQQFNSFISVQTPSGLWTAKAAKGAHDDAVMATSFAWFDVPPQIFLGEAK